MSTAPALSRDVPRWRGPLAGTSALLDRARRALDASASSDDADERFCDAHAGALRVAAAVVAEHGRPPSSRRKLVSVWVLLDTVAPHLHDWSRYFAASAADCRAIEAGTRDAVTREDADEQLRMAGRFLLVVEDELGLLALPVAS